MDRKSSPEDKHSTRNALWNQRFGPPGKSSIMGNRSVSGSPLDADSSVKLEVSMPSGRCATVEVSLSCNIIDVKKVSQETFGQGFLKLATSDGRLLDPRDPLRLSGLRNGDSLAAIAQQPKIAASQRGDSSKVHDQLRNVQQIYGTSGAFAAVLGNGRVVTWGNPGSGGDSSRVQEQLRNVQQICCTNHAFAAILADGTVVTWGLRTYGGNCSEVHDRLRNILHSADGTVVTWGDSHQGGDSSRVQDKLRNVQQICRAETAFAAILADRSVVTWGNPRSGGDSSRVQDKLRNVHQVFGAEHAFAAILADGTVVTWGEPDSGGDSSRVQEQLSYI
eukprot:s230_g23.t1